MLTFKLAVLLVVVVTVHGWARHKDEIPNGEAIPDPCDPVEVVTRVGAHSGHDGGVSGGLSQFGFDFRAAGMVWTTALCMMDSDGDGMLNGVELGDPNCGWSNGDTSPGPVLGHPGVCEPIQSAKCRALNGWLSVGNCPPLRITTPTPTTPVPTTPAPAPGPPCGVAPNSGYLYNSRKNCKKCKGKKNGLYKCDRYTFTWKKGKTSCCCLNHKPAKCPPCKVGDTCGAEDLKGEIMPCKCCKANLGLYKCPRYNPGNKKMCCCMDEEPPIKACKKKKKYG